MLQEYLTAWGTYRTARKNILQVIGIPESCRDPMSEFSERAALILLDGTLAKSRVQEGFDLTRHRGPQVQVKYLSNPSGKWVNEHPIEIQPRGAASQYALMIFEDLIPRHLIVFKRGMLGNIYAALGKRHKGEGTRLEFTQANYKTMIGDRHRYEQFLVEFFDVAGSESTSWTRDYGND